MQEQNRNIRQLFFLKTRKPAPPRQPKAGGRGGAHAARRDFSNMHIRRDIGLVVRVSPDARARCGAHRSRTKAPSLGGKRRGSFTDDWWSGCSSRIRGSSRRPWCRCCRSWRLRGARLSFCDDGHAGTRRGVAALRHCESIGRHLTLMVRSVAKQRVSNHAARALRRGSSIAVRRTASLRSPMTYILRDAPLRSSSYAGLLRMR
jgi:hypothetical protein